MPRKKSYSPESVVRSAMERFWHHGYEGTSVADLVDAIGISRHGLYLDFGDKRGLFLAALRTYVEEVVDPAMSFVETEPPSIKGLQLYFEHQIARAERAGLPGPGCLMANTLTEVAPHDPQVRTVVMAHLDRLTRGFARALGVDERRPDEEETVERQARALATFANGLWSTSRLIRDANVLRDIADLAVSAIEGANAHG